MPFSKVFPRFSVVFSRKFCGFLRFSTLFSKAFSRVFSRSFSSMRSARASFFCSFLVLCSHSASVPVEAFGFPDFQRKMLTHLPCPLLPTLRRPRPAPPLGTRTWFSHAYSSAARFRQDTRTQTKSLTPDFAVAVLWLADTWATPCKRFSQSFAAAILWLADRWATPCVEAMSIRLHIEPNGLGRLSDMGVAVTQL